MENDLRQKLIQMEAKNLMECMERLESISGLTGFFEDMKKSVVKMVTGGSNDVHSWYNVLHEKFKDATILITNTNELQITRNNITIVFKQDSNKNWKTTQNGTEYTITDANDLIKTVETYTKKGTPAAAEARDVLRYSQAILKCKATPAAVHF